MILALPVPQALLDLEDYKVYRAKSARLDLEGYKDSKVLLAQRVQLVLKEILDLEELLVHRDLKVPKVQLDYRDLEELLVQLVLLEQPVQKVILAQRL